MSTPLLFHSLPPELISHILLLSAALPSPSPHSPSSAPDPLTRRLALRQLRSLSLTCRAFRPLAQRELLRLAHRDGEGVRAWHAKEFGRAAGVVLDEEGKRREGEGLARLFRRVDVELWGEDVPDELVEVLQACEAKEEVVLACVERLKFEDVLMGENVTSFSARQCSFVGPPPPSSPPLSLPLSLPPPLPAPLSTTLRSLSLHLVTLRRASLPPTSLPNLRNLLLFLGSPSSLSSGDQHFPTIRAFLRSVAPQLRALSLDRTAFDGALKPELEGAAQENGNGEGAREPLRFPNLRLYGLYFDAASLSLVGSSLFFPSPSSSSSSHSSALPLLPPPPFLHLTLYPAPSALPVLEGLLASLFTLDGAEGSSGAWAWRGVEELRLDGLVRDVDVDWTGQRDVEEEEEGEGEEDEEKGGEGEKEERPRLAQLLSLAHQAGINCTVDPPSLSAASTTSNVAVETAGGRGGGRGGGGAGERGTFKRGFETSWWAFVREVEGRG
ncbi:hypothetical protein JCM6882_005112 [Rhodosporidiobolus microsporus]